MTYHHHPQRCRHLLPSPVLVAAAIFLLVVEWIGTSHAFPARDVPFNVTQPDGSVVQVRGKGDARENYLTDVLGYGIEQDDTGTYVYVEETETGEIVITSEMIHKDGPQDKKRKKKLHKKITDCKKKICGGTPKDPRDATPGGAMDEEAPKEQGKKKKSKTLRGTRRNLETSVPEEVKSEDITIDGRSRTPTTGVLKNLVVLLHFKDHAENKDRKNDIPSREDIDVLMNSDEPRDGIAPIGSLKSIYREASYGQLIIESTVTEWFVTAKSEAWYADSGSGTTSLHEALRDSLDYLDQNNIINFTDFDGDNDGKIDAITFLHSGYSAEWIAPDQYGRTYRNRIWSHQWKIWSDASGDEVGPWESKDGTIVDDYHISPALWGIRGTEIGHIGVIAHEVGHFIGLDDLYDTNGGGNGIGNYCFMSNSWGWDKSQEPPGSLSCWTKKELGWITPQEATYGINTISASTTSPDCIKIGDGNHGYPVGEYLLIENRQPKNLDAKIPQGGLAIYHIDEKMRHDVEGHPGQYGWPLNGRHYKVALLQADGDYHLEREVNYGDGGDLFHGDGMDRLMPSTTNRGPYPNTDAYQAGKVRRTGVRIYDISKSGDTMAFTFTDGTVELPSAQPTALPSSAPTQAPTAPTSTPTTGTPSSHPTGAPSQTPTGTPKPTGTPSQTPTGTPSGHPTGAPTQTPTGTPSGHPTGAPSQTPTATPSGHPTNIPTIVQSLTPTATPIVIPPPSRTASPTKQPTSSASLFQQPFHFFDLTIPAKCLGKGEQCRFPIDCCDKNASCKYDNESNIMVCSSK